MHTCNFLLATGYIQTMNWDGQSHYESHTDTCLTLSVPANHSIMISIVSLHLEPCCSCDFLELFLTHACTGNPAETVCENSDLDPNVYDTQYFSVRFHSNDDIQRTGFRLLFSFHPSQQRPSRLGSGKWDCAVPGASVWIQHFACSPLTFCDGGQDRPTDGCPSAEMCGSNVITLGIGCYRPFRSKGQITWDEAEDMCKSNHGHLVSLNTQQEWDRVTDWMETARVFEHKLVMVGLRFHTFPLRDV